MNNSLHIADLIVKKIKGTILSEEIIELEEWMNKIPENLAVFEKATDSKNQLSKLEVYNLFQKEKVWSSLEDKLFDTKTIKFFSSSFIKYAAAILILFSIGGVLSYLFTNKPASTSITNIDTLIKPGTQKAMLVLSNGSTVELGEESLQEIEEGDVKIKNEDKSLIYSAQKLRRRALVYNELKTPRGGGYNLKLADGTRVWLNAGSSLKFPVSFTDTTRQVFLEGEAYFEVSHNGKPFIVNSGDMDIRVLGTSFNVSAYQDESKIRTTLVEGRVRIDYTLADASEKLSEVLTPNKQAVIDKSESVLSVAEVNTSQYTSWMQGKFEFNNESLNAVMKRLARWYDFEYEFENTQAQDYHFTARIDNESSISTILEMLEMTTDVKFEIREQTIVVL